MSLKTAAHEVYSTGRDEFLRASLGAKALLLANVGGIMFEQGGGNEYGLGTIGGHVFRETHNIALTAMGAGGFSFGLQAGVGLLTVAALKQFPKTMEILRSKVTGPSKKKAPIVEQPVAETVVERTTPKHARIREKRHIIGATALHSLGDRWGTAFGAGTSVKAIDDNALEQHTTAENVRSVMADTSLVAGSVALIGAGLAAAFLANSDPGYQHVVSGVMDVVTNPGPYMTLSASRIFMRHRASMRADQPEAVEAGAQATPAITDAAYAQPVFTEAMERLIQPGELAALLPQPQQMRGELV